MKDNLKDLLNQFAGKTESSKGHTKENIYKKEYLSDDTDKQKNERNKIRKQVSTIFHSLNTYSLLSDKTKYNNLADTFIKFYFAVFTKNDFSFNSVMSDNSKDIELKDLVKKHLPTIQKRYESTLKKDSEKQPKKK